MGARENGEERNDHSTDVEMERDGKQGKEAESDYEAARDSFASQGEANSNEDTKVKRVSRVPKKLAKKESKQNSPRPTRSNSGRLVNTKLKYISPNNTQNKSPKPNKAAYVVKTIETQKPETVEVSSCPSSDVSGETIDKAIDGTITNDNSILGRAVDHKSTKGRATDDKAIDGIETDDQANEGGGTDDKAIERTATNEKVVEGTTTDDKSIEGIASDDKGIDGVKTGNKGAIEEAKEIDVLDEAPTCDQSSGTDDEIADTEQGVLDDDNSAAYEKNDEKIEELESKIEKLEQELREVAALEVMEQCVARLDVALFNAILRESENEIPSDPISDPILDSRVLPIPAGHLSFGSGAQLKNSTGSWSRWLTDTFGMDGDDSEKDGQDAGRDGDERNGKGGLNSFKLLNELSDLLMLPKDMLLENSIRKEVCPSIGIPLVIRILCNFTPDEFCPDPVPVQVLEELNSERLLERSAENHLISTFPCTAAPVVYRAPSLEDVAEKVADTSGNAEVDRRASMVQRRGYTSDDDLDDLSSPLMSLYDRSSPPSPCDGVAHLSTRQEGSISNVRYELLREVWSEHRD
ncbi:hypothetical protein ACQ4PT_071751 [Festuca glaucescens]